ncbi:protein lon-1-like [Uranotaenia lowii]|uniref:protein lon-1-like n=1 Tax=Uranotaenia lowii TaxID=190385 RepID=UPI00247AE303|nr:protein lon-1-like [Uranotaenia lowii]
MAQRNSSNTQHKKSRRRNILNLIPSVGLYMLSQLVGLSTQSCINGGVLLKSGLDPSDKYDILEEHNKLRQAVAKGLIPGQPGAENMLEMQWDDELASRAQAWADQCLFKHDPKKKLARFTMGQNLATIWSTATLDDDHDSDFPGRIRKWFDEVKKYSFGAKFSLATGHYMQLIWADTYLVGCGYSYYYSGQKYNKLYVCNYGPAGNVQGQQPYITGRPACEQHGLSKSYTHPGLCLANGGDASALYHHNSNNVIPPNYYSYQGSSNNHENQHYTSAPLPVASMAYTAALQPSSYQPPQHQQQPYDNHILYNLVFDQHKQQQQQQNHYQQQHPAVQQTYHHHQQQAQQLRPAVTTMMTFLKPTATAASNILKSPFLTYRWDLLFNFLH